MGRAPARELPWRRTRDPYAVLVCEVMSQQTQIERVRALLGALDRALADGRGARGRAARRRPARLAGARLSAPCAGSARRRAAHRERRLAGSRASERPARRRALHGGGDPLLRLRAAGAAARRERPSRAGAALPRRPRGRRPIRGRCRRADGRRSRALPGAAALRRLPAARRLPRRARGRRLGPGGAAARAAGLRGSLRERRGALLRAALAGERPPAAADPQAAASLLADGLVAARAGFSSRRSRCSPAGLWGVVDARADRQQPDTAARAHAADGARRRPGRRDDRRAAVGERRPDADRRRVRPSRRLRPRRLPGGRLGPDGVGAADLARRAARAQPRRRERDAAAVDRRQGALRLRRRSCSAPTRAASSRGGWCSPAAARRPRHDRGRRRPRREPAPAGRAPRWSSPATASPSPASITRASSTRTRARCCRWPSAQALTGRAGRGDVDRRRARTRRERGRRDAIDRAPDSRTRP